MVSRFDVAQSELAANHTGWRLGRVGFAIGALAIELFAILGWSIVSGAGYHVYAYGDVGMIDVYARLGFLTAFLYTLPFLFRDEYQFHDYLDGKRSPGRIVWIWGFAFACLGVIGFMTKTTEAYSRGWLAIFFVTGPLVVMFVAGFIQNVLRRLIELGRVEPRRLMLVGDSTEVDRFEQQLMGNTGATRIVASVIVPVTGGDGENTEGFADLQDRLRDAVARARLLHVNDVIVFSERANRQFTDHAIAAFSVLPAALHLGAGDLIGRFRKAEIWRFGDVTTLSLTVPPLTAAEAVIKRTFDLAVSLLALCLLAPLMLTIAVLIKLDSHGPIFFRQRRRGFNHEEFKIVKFRTMSTLDDGDEIVQARSDDERFTRVGQYLRRWNLDELPQLLNVVRGEMSLVGPRPHAVAHDVLYEARLRTYPRRLNMRPGITGWAQVHGFRGATNTDDAMQQRLDYDLYYIDNWSVWLDLYVIALTFVSWKAYRNAH
ncbi:MAG: exopolysaccharide biosynthesis polyprenyl glycosylphosphotransferase [Alphaproteobacteria bacterium]|nr:exopolysaccharide biosynthesis polyprenyl glycosylphosphotransferase [Alphaproteobacteria bacterium]